MLAIALSQPQMGKGTLRLYAETVASTARKYQLSPYLLIAVGHNESRWNAHLVGGKDGMCVGIGQHCLFASRVCVSNGLDSPECQEVKSALLYGPYNIQQTGLKLVEWRKLCRKKVGASQPRHFLQGYQGYVRPAQGLWCGRKRVKGQWRDQPLPKQTRQVINYQRRLERRFRYRGGSDGFIYG